MSSRQTEELSKLLGCYMEAENVAEIRKILMKQKLKAFPRRASDPGYSSSSSGSFSMDLQETYRCVSPVNARQAFEDLELFNNQNIVEDEMVENEVQLIPEDESVENEILPVSEDKTVENKVLPIFENKPVENKVLQLFEDKPVENYAEDKPGKSDFKMREKNARKLEESDDDQSHDAQKVVSDDDQDETDEDEPKTKKRRVLDDDFEEMIVSFSGSMFTFDK